MSQMALQRDMKASLYEPSSLIEDLLSPGHCLIPTPSLSLIIPSIATQNTRSLGLFWCILCSK